MLVTEDSPGKAKKMVSKFLINEHMISIKIGLSKHSEGEDPVYLLTSPKLICYQHDIIMSILEYE